MAVKLRFSEARPELLLQLHIRRHLFQEVNRVLLRRPTPLVVRGYGDILIPPLLLSKLCNTEHHGLGLHVAIGYHLVGVGAEVDLGDMENLVFLTDRLNSHGTGAGIGSQDAPNLVSEDQVLGLTHRYIRLGMRIPDEELDGMLSQEAALGIDLLHSQFDGVYPVLAVESPGAGDCQVNTEVIGFCCQDVIYAGQSSQQNQRKDNCHQS